MFASCRVAQSRFVWTTGSTAAERRSISANTGAMGYLFSRPEKNASMPVERLETAALLALLADPVAVGKCVQLFDITELVTGLLLHPSPEDRLQGPMTMLKRATRQRIGRSNRENTRPLTHHRRDNRDQIQVCLMGLAGRISLRMLFHVPLSDMAIVARLGRVAATLDCGYPPVNVADRSSRHGADLQQQRVMILAVIAPSA